ncbi:hypothetical protein [Streptomyces sp. NPDC059460]|uniref:hypothetical protein n=1 Tax=Streptomyces sp. NPDC059460 TaxID=3346840 RepID=UPI0036B19A12
MPGSERSADRAAHLAHLYAPGICPAPENDEGLGSEPRTCPVHLAEAVAKGIAEIEEQYENELQAEEEVGEEPQEEFVVGRDAGGRRAVGVRRCV